MIIVRHCSYNYTSLHSSLLYQATADEALVRKYLNDKDYKISVSIWPLPVTKDEEQYKMWDFLMEAFDAKPTTSF